MSYASTSVRVTLPTGICWFPAFRMKFLRLKVYLPFVCLSTLIVADWVVELPFTVTLIVSV